MHHKNTNSALFLKEERENNVFLPKCVSENIAICKYCETGRISKKE